MTGEVWPELKLSDVLAEPIRNGYSPTESQAWTGVQMLGLGCLSAYGFNPVQLKNAPESVSAMHPAILRDGDLLVSRANTRTLVGMAGIYRDFGTPCIYPDLMMRVRPSERYLVEFLEIVLRSPRTRRRLTAMAQGTSESMVKISGETLRRLPIPDVPIDKQWRVVEVIDSFTELERGIEASITKLHSVRQGVVLDFMNRVQPDWTPVRDLGEVRMGKQLSPDSRAAMGQYPYLRVANVHAGWIDYSDVNTMGFTKGERSVYGLSPGDILLNEGQSLELVGRSAIYRGAPGEFFFQNTLVRFRPQERVVPEYAQIIFEYWLETGVFARIAKKTTSIAHLGGGRFAGLEFPFVSLAEQQILVNGVSACDANIAGESGELNKLRRLKQGLVDDLLSGRVAPLP